MEAFILKYEALKFIKNDSTIWEREPLAKLAKTGELKTYHHQSFWHPMDTLRDQRYLEAVEEWCCSVENVE